MYRVGLHFRFQDGKGREFLLQNFLQKVYGKLLAFVVPDIGDYHPVIGIKNLVVFHICSNKIRSGSQCLRNQEATSPTTKSHLADCFSRQPCMPDNRHLNTALSRVKKAISSIGPGKMPITPLPVAA